jgi:glycerophosphoryl diester phosphodiesterase
VTLVIAHQGACWDVPDNTMEAFELAIEQGSDYIEFDVRGAADGMLVVSHDPVPSSHGSGQTPDVPTLDAVLEVLSGRVGIAVEIKEPESTDGTLAALERHDIEPGALLVLSFKIRALETVRRARPDVRCVLHLGWRPDPTAATRFWGVGFRNKAATPGRLRSAQALGLATTVFTVNEPDRMRSLVDLDVSGIFTDRPALLRDVLAHA